MGFLKKMKLFTLFILLLLIFMSLGLIGCSGKTSDKTSGKTEEISFKNITPQEAKKRLESEKEIKLIDVRTKEEYDSGHIPNSILIPLDKLENSIQNEIEDKNTVIFVYCRSGNRSTTASNILVKLGYKNVFNLNGINDWPYEIVK